MPTHSILPPQQRTAPQPDDTEGLVKMLSELYGIQKTQEQEPGRLALQDAQAKEMQGRGNYYQTEADKYGDYKDAIGFQKKADALNKILAPGDPRRHALENQLLSAQGFDMSQLEPPKPKDEFGPADAVKTTAAQYPGIDLTTPENAALKAKADAASQPSQYGWAEQLAGMVSGKDPAVIRAENSTRKLRSKAGVSNPYTGPFTSTFDN